MTMPFSENITIEDSQKKVTALDEAIEKAIEGEKKNLSALQEEIKNNPEL